MVSETWLKLVEHGGVSCFPANGHSLASDLIKFLYSVRATYTMEYDLKSGWKFTVTGLRPQTKKIHNDLFAAYAGYYEDDIAREIPRGPGPLTPADDLAQIKWVEAKIRSHTPKKRLEVYLHWNGIIGWTGRIWDITQGEFES